MTEQKQEREAKKAGGRSHHKSSGAADISGQERNRDLQNQNNGFGNEQVESGQAGDFQQWDDSRMLVPSSLELGAGAVDKYVISKQIVKMQEPRRLTRDDMDERRIIYPESRNRDLVNRFRHLRTKLLELSGGNNFTMVVSGACEGAGTSFMALNLAAAFAFDQSKTALIIDCNLRDPSLHYQLELAAETGLTDFLEDPDYDIGRIIYPTGIPRLRLIPAGSQRETPSEFFTSFRMKQFLQAIRRRYPDRFIVLDTAPISESPDARILGELCDYSMLVVPHGKITATAAENAAQAFDPEKFVGAVING
ncbi:exopolysaccharide/PEP-CTERM locus tyrosine autokinase [Marinobacter sp. es.048]|uniref:polysaccharide biosynthesis protein n=1 Tax=Marinobacter sp. es.048 TaxID=1761795 RepID=UPI000B6DF98F|nr:polysaccharide biosynthesis protein [Marinobacter sp. es.048]SNC68234.1 exopolysaccharide/PEP-CTERM locus tyrosine autokinase [Marinobacter sp. es.048]